MNILVTGSEGFVAKNLIIRLKHLKYNIIKFNKNNHQELKNKILNQMLFSTLLEKIDLLDAKDFFKNNVNLSKKYQNL